MAMPPPVTPTVAGRPPGQRLAAWIQATRPPFLVATLLPVLTGLALVARQTGQVNWPLALLTLVGSLAMQIGTNLANDYYDFIQYRGDVPYEGGSGVLQEGKLSLDDVYRGTWVTFAFTAAVGIYLGTRSTPLVWLLTAIGLIGAIYYSAPPIRFGYRGWAEVVCGISMGPVIVLGVYMVQTGRPSWEALAVSFPLASFVAMILYGESIHDIQQDQQTGKWTVAARLGETRAVAAMMAWIAATGVLSVLGVATGLLPQLLLLELVPMALVLRVLRPWAGKREGGPDTAKPRFGRLALRLYLSTGLLLFLGLALGL